MVAYFSSTRLRRHARHRRGTTHANLYQALRLVLDGLGNEHGLPQLGLPGLGGLYDDTKVDEALHGLSLSNEALLAAVRALSVIKDPGTKRNRVIDYRHLDAEELGTIYETHSAYMSTPADKAAPAAPPGRRQGPRRNAMGSWEACAGARRPIWWRGE